MKSFASRRLRNAALTLAALLAIFWWTRVSASRLGRPDFITGYLLYGALVLLAAYNLRKKLPVLPWFTSATWLQTHIYVGLATAVVFAMHVGWRVPDGLLETTLTLLYLSTLASGVVGLYWTRTIPPQLARVSEEFIYERIPQLRASVQQRAEQVTLETVRATGTSTLADFFAQRLQGYFEKPRGWGYFLRPSSRLRRVLLAELTETARYLSEPEREASEQLFSLIRRRDDLDFHHALQWRLKMWLFVHLGLTYPLLIIASLHALLTHLFDGGAL